MGQADKNLEEQIEEGKADAILSYIPFLCFIPLFKSNITDFAKKHVKQGLLLLIIEIIALFFLVDLVNLEVLWRILLFMGFGALFLFLSYYFKNLWKLPIKTSDEQIE